MERYKKYSIVICIVGILFLLTGVTYSFFNYTKTGSINNLGTGRISFSTTQSNTLNITNMFPMTSSEAEEANLDSVTIAITGDTEYADGEEYLISLVDVTNTLNGKKIPISYMATYEATSGKTIGSNSNDYWNERENKDASIYKFNTSGKISEGKQVLVGYIDNGVTGISGTLTMSAYIDADRLAISDTYDGTESGNMGTTNEWVNGRVVFTTSEWNSLQNTPISFKIRAESNEGIWVTPTVTLANQIKGRLGHDGVVAVNTNGDLYTGTGTIREYRYSGIGNYCTYTDGTNNYNISVEGTECPEHAYKGSEGYTDIGSSDGILIWGNNGTTELDRVNIEAIDSGLKNYVMFNNEMWRIIGVFGDNVKIMKDLPLLSNVTTNTISGYDEIYTNTLTEQYLIKYNIFYANPKYGYFYYNNPVDNNYTYNLNDWTHSGLMYYLNEEKIGSYYNTINRNYKNLIDTTTYYLGNVSSDIDSNNWWAISGIAKEVYVQEHGNVECSADLIQWSQGNNCNIWNGNSATWRGKIGLIYPSDYAYAASTDKWSTNVGAYYYNGGSLNNWMFNTDAGFNWMISPASFGHESVAVWDGHGHVDDGGVNGSHTVRPVLNLVAQTETIDGDGSYSNPYILNVE